MHLNKCHLELSLYIKQAKFKGPSLKEKCLLHLYALYCCILGLREERPTLKGNNNNTVEERPLTCSLKQSQNIHYSISVRISLCTYLHAQVIFRFM